MLIIPNVTNIMQDTVCCASKGTTPLTVLTWLVTALWLQPMELVGLCSSAVLGGSPFVLVI